MLRVSLKIAAATAAFALVHSALASRRSKRTSVALFGERNAQGLYRAFYLAQSAVTVSMLVDYIRRQPSAELYRVKGGWAVAMRIGQIAALAHATAAAKQVGIMRITGVENLATWATGRQVPPMPEAQGPAFDEEAQHRRSGPFAWSRHPLNFSPLPAFWLWPRMTSSLLAFNLAATVYLIIGSIHEESRLLHLHCDKYERYRSSAVPFYWPQPNRKALEPVALILLPRAERHAS